MKNKRTFDLMFEVNMRISVDPVLFEYIKSKEFTDSFYDWDEKDLLDCIGRIVSKGGRLSSIDGFSKEHDAMVFILDNPDYYLVDNDEVLNVDWSKWTEQDEKFYSMKGY